MACPAIKCRNRSNREHRSKGFTFHRFPYSNPSILEKWLINMKRTGQGNTKWYPSRNQRLCSAHFTSDCFDRTGLTVRLKGDAVPTIFHFPKDMVSISMDSARNRRKKTTPAKIDRNLSSETSIQPDVLTTDDVNAIIESPIKLTEGLGGGCNNVNNFNEGVKFEDEKKHRQRLQGLRLSSIVESLKKRKVIPNESDENFEET